MYQKITTRLAQPIVEQPRNRKGVRAIRSSGTPVFTKQFAGASAAYSLRRLGSGPVVRLRRAGDSTESDFTASELTGSVTGSELVTNGDFATDSDWTKGSPWSISGGQAIATSGSGAGYLQTDYNITPADWYLVEVDIQSISSSYIQIYVPWSGGRQNRGSISTAGVHRVLCKSDSTSFDFSLRAVDATNAVINSVSVKPYTPTVAEAWSITNPLASTTADSTATTWYDQSGSGNDATQTTLDAQPKLITAGVTETENGKPTLVFDDSSLGVAGTALSLERHDSFFVMRSSKTNFVTYAQVSGNGGGNMWVANTGNPSTSVTFRSGSPTLFVDGVQPTQATRGDVHTALGTGEQLLSTTIGADTSLWTDTNIGQFPNYPLFGSSDLNGNVQELVVYPSDQSANRVSIEENVSDAYSMPYPTQSLVSQNMPSPAGAYSLRSLTGSESEKVVRLRRGSDSTERDFTANELISQIGDELVTNGGFDGSDGWGLSGSGAGNAPEITGGEAVWDGTQTAYSAILSDYSLEQKKYIVKFDITCSNYSVFYLQFSSTGIPMNQLGITSGGSYELFMDFTEANVNRFRFYTSEAGVTATVDNVSVKEATPSVAEAWVHENGLTLSRGVSFGRLDLTFSNATATTWYDQSNEDSGKEIVGTGGSLVESDWILNGPNAVFSNGQIDLYRDDERLDLAEPDGKATYVGTPIKAGRTYATEITYGYNGTDIGGYMIQVGDDSYALWTSGYQDLTPTVDGTVVFQKKNSKDSHITITALSVRDVTNDATQTTIDAQPILIQAGVTQTDNGKPALVFDGVNDGLASSYSGDATATFVIVANRGSGNNRLFAHGGSAAKNGIYRTFPHGATILNNGGSVLTNAVGGTSGSQALIFALNDGSGAGEVSENGGAVTSGALGTSGMAELSIGGSISGINGINSYYQELIFYPSDQSATRTIIETNINNHFNIY